MKQKFQLTQLDRLIGAIAPQWQLQRVKARMAVEVMKRHYEGAAGGRRTQGWYRSGSDANQATGPFINLLRDRARDLVRNNPYAESGLSTIVDHVVGTGIVPKPMKANPRALQLWQEWAYSTACDADGRNDFPGLQKLVMRTVAESGECLIRRRMRRPEDGLPIPMQLQVLEPDFIDTSKDSIQTTSGGGRIVQGVEYDALGVRIAYWLFQEHPGSAFATTSSIRVPAANILHVFKPLRPGQVRGVSWFAPVLVRFKDFDEFEDATLMKQKIAACLAILTSDTDGTGPSLGNVDNAGNADGGTLVDELYPGMIMNVGPGRQVTVVQPPTVREYADYVKTNLRAIATGLGVTYEDLTGDYADMPFSAARMSRLRHWARIEDWRWRLMIPQFCDPVWNWVVEVAAITRGVTPVDAEWTAQPLPMIDPVNEGLAYMRNRRAGLQTLGEQLRERGYDPQAVMDEFAAENKRLDALKIILDSDPRVMTQGGQLQGKGVPKPEPAAAPTGAIADDKKKKPAAGDEDDEEEEDELARAAGALWGRR
jgi:lambda family phage portal protein